MQDALRAQPEAVRQSCVLAGGDDYEMAFTAPVALRDTILALANVTRIGNMTGKLKACRSWIRPATRYHFYIAASITLPDGVDRYASDSTFLFRHPAHFVALGFGAGLMPKAPGAWGTLAAFPLFLLVRPCGDGVVLGLGVALFLIGIWASRITGEGAGVADHGGIVIDEIAAFLIVLAFTPHHALVVRCIRAVSCIRYRQTLADPAGRPACQGGFGVMFDDLLAAYSIAGLWIARTALSWGTHLGRTRS